ncbi:hypothetical protein BDD12DRAFT_803994 [Trichophaea hybrida]|nr:hypothetical protein BDD12DRAFT_803994 [Trichophaea hybrida]
MSKESESLPPQRDHRIRRRIEKQGIDLPSESPSMEPYIANLPNQFSSPDLFRIVVGPEQAVYYIHKQTLISQCPYFAGLINFNGTEVFDNTATLSDVEPVVFKMFIAFIYTNYYDCCNDVSRTEEAVMLSAKVYIFADRMCMPDLKAVALDILENELQANYASCNYGVNIPQKTCLEEEKVAELVAYVYSNTPDREDSEELIHALRALLAMYCASCLKQLMSRGEFMRVVRDYKDFSEDLLWFARNGANI